MKERRKTTIAGQALIEGLLMRGTKKTAIVVRKSDGEHIVKVTPTGTATHGAFARLPIVRGVVSFWDSMKYGVSALMYSADFFDDGGEEKTQPSRFEAWLEKKLGSDKFDKAAMGLAVVLGITLPVVLFMLLPTLVAGLFGEGLPSIVRNLTEGAIRLVIFLGFLYMTSKQKDIHRTYMYHGAEHKTIACYERELPLTVENVRTCSRRHPRCGTSFLFMVMIVSILILSLFTWGSPLKRLLLRLALLPVIAGISYEINRYAGRHDNILTKVIRAPGLWLQGFTTAEPEDCMLEVAIDALTRVIPENEGEDRW